MGGVAIVVGSAKAASDELRAAQELAPAAGVIPVKRALSVCSKPLLAWVTLHPEQAKAQTLGRDIEGVPLFCSERVHNVAGDWRIVRERWSGTSALYAVQIALEELGCHSVILAGCPIDSAQGCAYRMKPGQTKWANGYEERYRKSWRIAHHTIKDRVRSMSGWTKELLGAPTPEWLEAMEKQK
jgi:hypothetical protein